MDPLILNILDKMKKIDVSGLEILNLFESFNPKSVNKYNVSSKKLQKVTMTIKYVTYMGTFILWKKL